jgi:hypothetical protein
VSLIEKREREIFMKADP